MLYKAVIILVIAFTLAAGSLPLAAQTEAAKAQPEAVKSQPEGVPALLVKANQAYAAKDYLTFRGTYGTSFRAPNLREQFLAPLARSESQAGDPCKVPAAAIGNTGGANFYIPGLDVRSPTVLANCVADGINPTLMGIDATANFSVFDGGAEGLEPETSTSWTIGANFQQPWYEGFRFHKI